MSLHLSVVGSLLLLSIILFFIYSPVDGYLDCLQFGDILYNTSVNVYIYVFLWTYTLIFGGVNT